MKKYIERLKELLHEDKRVKIDETEDGWYDHEAADSEWIKSWGKEIMNILTIIDNNYKTHFHNGFMGVQSKFADINWRYYKSSSYKIEECVDDSKKCLQQIIEKIENLE